MPTNPSHYLEPGHRFYLKKDLARRLTAEADFLGLDIDALIVAKLNISYSDHDELIQRTTKIQDQIVKLNKICETVLLDSAYSRGAIEPEINPNAQARAEELESRRAKILRQTFAEDLVG